MLLSNRQKEILIGTLLGDGCLEKNGKNVRLRIEHGLSQKDYLDWKYRELQNLIAGKPRLVQNKGGFTEKIYAKWHFSTLSLFELNDYWRKFYFRKKKKIPSNIIEFLKSPLSLAVWYMDDGYKRNDCNASRISTDSFSYKENKLLQECLKINFGLNVRLHRKGTFWNIYIPSPELKKFYRIVKPYIVPEMDYKISLTP